ncbi:MAG: glycosyltransferase family 4 protein [bacterium]
MTRYAFFTHVLFALGLFMLARLGCWLMIRWGRIIDVPNERSSHEVPTPKSGGIVIVLTFFIGVIAIYTFGNATLIKRNYFGGFVFAALFIAGVSLYDDLRYKSFAFKLICQIIAVSIVMAFGLVIHQISWPGRGKINLGIMGYIITFLWIIGLTNAYNFMDGINGLAAGMAVIVSLFFGILCFLQGSLFVYIICYTLIAGSSGFLVFNFPKPRLFMGDVGSAFLGFVFATLGIIAALYDHSHTSLFVMPLLLFNFIYDTFFTFIRRLIARENVFSAHRQHLYQLFNQLGYSHASVSLFHFAVCFAQGIGAWVMLTIEIKKGVPRYIPVYIPFFLFQIIYSIIIIKKSKKARLI